MYNTPLWRARRLYQLRQHPLCALCLERKDIVVAEVAHHIEPHRGDWERFVSIPLQSLCKPCHDGIVQSQERLGFSKGCDVHGAPLAAHRFEKKKQN
jgi:5-methylcytosine-specific restriction protein A